jgi:anaerobic magnesium-protoporphyrin IX monomethyl ester cyclase
MKYMLLNLPNPPVRNIFREYAGGFGILGTLSNEILLPTYLLYAASAMENSGCEYVLLDAQGEHCTPEEVIKVVRESNPEVLITWVSLPSFYDDLRLLDNIKNASPSTIIIVLGAVSNTLPEDIIKHESVDIVVRGYYPHYNLILHLVQIFNNNPVNKGTFNKINGAVYKNNGHIINGFTQAYEEDLDNLSLDVYHKIPIEKYIGDYEMKDGSTTRCLPIVTGVGCPQSCTYCPYPVGYGKKIKTKSIDKIIAEILYLNENFGIKGFVFREQNFTHNKKRVMDLCDQIIQRGLGIKWVIESRVDSVSEELVTKMRDAGCFRIMYGVETGAQNILYESGKPGVNLEDIKRAFTLTNNAGIYTMALLIIGLPGENRETIEDTTKFLQEINPDKISLFSLTPYPGTELYETASEQGWLISNDWSQYTGYNAVMAAGEMDIDHVNCSANEIKRKFRNWKIIHDNVYRTLYIKSLPRKIWDRCLVWIYRTVNHANVEFS